MFRRTAVLAVVAAAIAGALRVVPSMSSGGQPQAPHSDYFALDDTGVPDDTVLSTQLERAVDLRLREDCMIS